MSREAILAAIREVPLPDTCLPDAWTDGIAYPDPVEQFKSLLKAVGGEWVEMRDLDGMEAFLRSRFPDAKVIHCSIPGVWAEKGGTTGPVHPRSLESLEVVVATGILGVAETAAVWVDDTQVPHRVVYFCTQHLVLTLDSRSIVHNMHEAYSALDIQNKQWGTFISGPSKTADIEQCLVIGAHGARSLTVVLH